MATSTPTLSRDTDDIVWRRLNRTFWVGRRDDRHFGSIEHGRYFTATDGTGGFAGRYRSFDDADLALRAPQPAAGDVPVERLGALALVTGAAGTTAVGLALMGWLVLR